MFSDTAASFGSPDLVPFSRVDIFKNVSSFVATESGAERFDVIGAERFDAIEAERFDAIEAERYFLYIYLYLLH